jgi:hypothetical protein
MLPDEERDLFTNTVDLAISQEVSGHWHRAQERFGRVYRIGRA